VAILYVIRYDGDPVVQGIQLGFFAQTARSGIGRIFANRQTHAPAVFSPFKVVGALWVALGSNVHDYKIGLDSPIGGLHDRTVTESLGGLYALCEIDGIPPLLITNRFWFSVG